MIAENQKNIKVHFAGCENLIRSNLVLKSAKVNYSLFTIFPFLCNEFGIKHGYQNKNQTYHEISINHYKNSVHCIQDSGLFSLMFGSYKGKKSKDFIYKWYERLVSLTKEAGFKGAVVEVDCQKMLGVNEAWKFRERMRNDLTENRQINVFHIEDGKKGLDRMIEFSNYIAISVPELKSLGKGRDVERIANYIKNKKPEIDIHLLGCTENKLLRKLKFCSSADSTSWVSFNKYGWFKYNDGKKTISIKKSNVKRDKLKEKYYDRLIPIFGESRVKMTESLLYYHACDLMQIEYLKKQYTIYAGPQN